MLNPILILNTMLILMKKNPKFKDGDQIRIWKYKNFFAKGYTPNLSKEFLLLAKLKIQSHGLMLLMI